MLLGLAVLPLGIVLGILFALGLIPLSAWISTKLFLVPSVMILEGVGVRRGIVRSWVLTRRRFWSTFGVLAIISLAFGFVAQVISLPLSLLSSGLTVIVAPTGADEVSTLISYVVLQLVGQIGILLVQCIAVVVQSTSAVLVYVDARMRVEGLDHDLAAYVEARDAGRTGLVDPYRVGVGRTWAPAPPWGAPPVAWPAPGGGPAPTAPGWSAPSAAQPSAGQPIPVPQPAPAPQPFAAPQPAATAPADPPPQPATPPVSPSPAAPPSDPTSWAAPGSPPREP
ncbi:glycerophosphoryl diester phosphodiesterase membrane domain-containing protein [Microbacterium sp. B19]|uniref:glycerophosphoryl diester phosphodiesterase membrane domain-containing protein n=1 Tax=Microbacterium sp. B19 TaxID=96765 RepID=UPI001955356D|nr:glycerophosphoryl diester phosphodiesterase membrane domain-containing protein [Microbacterium sp. B19]